MDAKQKKFVDWLVTGCRTHDEWLTVVRYGLPTLLKDQDVLIEVVINEAKRGAVTTSASGGRSVGGVKPSAVQRILNELGLRLEVVG